MPWNFPFWQVFRFAAPNLMAGNVGLLSHASNVPGSAASIEEVFREAGFPTGAFQNLEITNETLDELIRDERIRGVTLTGSVGAGSAVAQRAAAEIKPTVLELGGSDPFVVLDDCDVDYTVEQAVRARTLNSGQSCIAGKRFIVEEGIYPDFLERFESRMADLEVGDPTDSRTDIGPMAREDLRDRLHRQVTRSIEQGANCRLGGEIPDGSGFFYPPTILTDVDESMPVFEEETFGPVAAVVRAAGPEHAVRLANRSIYGLGASVWTDTERGEELVSEIEAGHVAVNGIVKSDPRLPFGGIKKSGYGRELARDGLLEFLNKKTVWVK
jgi:succinate-semialdehyde dehydrogenase/glutarate-semialdehyde dehydrogenase